MNRNLAVAALALAAFPAGAAAQDTLDLTSAQTAAVRSDPRTRQRELLRAATDLRLAVIVTQGIALQPGQHHVVHPERFQRCQMIGI